jgi:hypothetical protein
MNYYTPNRRFLPIQRLTGCLVACSCGVLGAVPVWSQPASPGEATPSAFDLLLGETTDSDATDGSGAGVQLDERPEPSQMEAAEASEGGSTEGSAEGSGAAPAAADASDSESPDAASFDLGRQRVTAARVARPEPSSFHRFTLGELHAVPRRNASEALMASPGVLVTNAGGDGHASSMFLRGFAAGEGENLETLVDGVPINEVSNAHSHGYADTHMVMPEVLESVVVQNGPFAATQGDFAFAGTGLYELGVSGDRRGTHAGVRVGSFNTRRTHFLFAPATEETGTFAAGEFQRSDGFGVNRASERATVIARYDRGLEREASSEPGWGLTAIGYANRFDQAGVVRLDQIEAGRIDRLDTHDPGQGGESSRALLVFRSRIGAPSARFSQRTWLGARSFRMRENFTGTLTENRYQALTLGSRGTLDRGFYRWNRLQQLSGGYSIRYDDARTTQLSLRPVTGIPSARSFDAELRQLNLSMHGGVSLAPHERVTIEPSVRMDAFSFGVLDLNQPAEDRDGVRVPNQTSEAFGYAWNPRATVSYRVVDPVSLSAAWGVGTRSSDATALSDSETAPFATSQQAELGALYDVEVNDWNVHAQTSWVWARVDQDLVFVPEESRNQTVGGSRRNALLASVRVKRRSWLDANLSYGWARGVLEDTGDQIPYVPTSVVRLDAVVLSPTPLGASAQLRPWVSVGFTGMPGRPLPLQQTGTAFVVLDAAAGLRSRWLDLSLEARNLLDREYAQEEFFYASALGQGAGTASRFPVIHQVAGEPLSVFLNAVVHLDPLFSSTPNPGPTP